MHFPVSWWEGTSNESLRCSVLLMFVVNVLQAPLDVQHTKVSRVQWSSPMMISFYVSRKATGDPNVPLYQSPHLTHMAPWPTARGPCLPETMGRCALWMPSVHGNEKKLCNPPRVPRVLDLDVGPRGVGFRVLGVLLIFFRVI